VEALGKLTPQGGYKLEKPLEGISQLGELEIKVHLPLRKFWAEPVKSG
jgi:hypothetical protein